MKYKVGDKIVFGMNLKYGVYEINGKIISRVSSGENNLNVYLVQSEYSDQAVEVKEGAIIDKQKSFL